MFNLLRRKDLSARRTAFVCASDGWATASVLRAGAGRPQLESCNTFTATPDAQEREITGKLVSMRGASGAVSCVMDPADYQLLLIEMPDVLPAELRAAVRWRLKEAIDFPVEDAIVDVFDIPEQVRRTGSKMMYAIAAKRQVVERHVSLMKSAPLFDVIDIPELALRNLAAQLPEAADGLILLWLNDDSAKLLVVKQSTLYLTRHVQFAENFGAPAEGPPPEVEAIALELQRSTDYFESHYEQASINHLIIAPNSARTQSLTQYLSSETSMRVQLIDIERALDCAPGLEPPDHRGLLAIGAALRSDQKSL